MLEDKMNISEVTLEEKGCEHDDSDKETVVQHGSCVFDEAVEAYKQERQQFIKVEKHNTPRNTSHR